MQWLWYVRKLLIKLIYVESYVLEKYISIILRNCNWIIIQKKYHYIWFNIWEIQKKKKINYSFFISITNFPILTWKVMLILLLLIFTLEFKR